ncbi:MAG TPA: sigma factor-like helix-turn-helix DNA-binding protein, partial [Polyangiaceae bacterium]
SHPASERALEDQPSSASPLQPGLLEEKRRAVLLEQAIRKLPERQATAITLVHLQGFTGEEAAQVMGTSQEALESLLARARRSLKASLLLAGVEARRGGE